MNPFEFVIAILVIIFTFSLIKTRMTPGTRSEEPLEDSEENVRLRSQVKQMQDRINVLEKIVTDRGAQTAAQIEALRERDKIAEGDGA